MQKGDSSMNPINPTPDRDCIGYLVRHGELNIDHRWDSWGPYVLSPEGREAAEKAGQWLSYEKIGRFITSDLPRCVQSAEIIMNMVDASCQYLATDPNLRAWNLGEFTGKEKTPERKEKLQYYRDHPDEPVPGGESWNNLHERVQVAFQYLCTPYDGKLTVIVTHNSVLKALLCLDEKGDLVEDGGIVRVDMTEKGELEFVAVLGATSLDKKVDTGSSCG